MPTFLYVAHDLAGRKISGKLTAASNSEAVGQIAGRQLVPLSVTEDAVRGFQPAARFPASYYSQLSDLLRTGVPLLGALDVLRRQASSQATQEMLDEMRAQLADGVSLSDAMRSEPQIFSTITTGIVQAGEEGGFLEEALRRIGTLQSRTAELRSRIVGALVYPLLLMVAMTVIVFALLIYFVPKFAPIFERLSAQNALPWATWLLIAVSDFLRGYCGWLAVFGAACVLVMWDALRLAPIIRRVLTHLSRFRWLGVLVREAVSARFCLVLGTLLKNQVPLVRALHITRQAIGDRAFSQRVEEAAHSVADGGRLSTQLSQLNYIPTDVAEMIAIGEQANTLDAVLLEAADILEKRLSRRLDLAIKLLEPAMLCCIAAIILFLVIGLMLPILDVSGTVF
jgi:general secretion pathway protein F